jgi:hypothetical protein
MADPLSLRPLARPFVLAPERKIGKAPPTVTCDDKLTVKSATPPDDAAFF